MLGNRKFIVDNFCEIRALVDPWVDGEFYDFSQQTIIPGAIYVIGRKQFMDHCVQIKELTESGTIFPIFSNPMEGSETMFYQINQAGYAELCFQNKALIITGGDMPAEYLHLLFDNFLAKVLDFDENIEAIKSTDKIYTKLDKPYKFLFLNGRGRSHRKYLLERFKINGLLDQSLWTNLDDRPIYSLDLRYNYQGHEFGNTSFEIKQLPCQYEVERYLDQLDKPIETPTQDLYIKYHLFNQEWGDIYINPAPYIDTYFSFVTETVFTYPYSFRTEKIAKPIAMAHPFVVASNKGYYRDLHNIGFKTFGHLIDESFDSIENPQERLERVAQVVEDLCQQNLAEFLSAAEEVCKYNQQHLVELHSKIYQEFPNRFYQFVTSYINE
jgi:hypothetical protein